MKEIFLKNAEIFLHNVDIQYDEGLHEHTNLDLARTSFLVEIEVFEAY